MRDAVFGGEEACNAQIRYETGHIDSDGYFDYFCRATRSRPDRRRLERAFCDIFAPIDETWKLVERLVASGHNCSNPLQHQSAAVELVHGWALSNTGQGGASGCRLRDRRC